MRNFSALARVHAYHMAGVDNPPPVPPPPIAPVITAVNSTHASWRGAALASTYTLETSSDGKSGWVVCGKPSSATDNDTPFRLPCAVLSYIRVVPVGVTGLRGPASLPFPTS